MTAGRARFIVSGKVQGVWFRACTRQRAQELGLGGSARNLDDGTVEVLATGESDAIDALARWLPEGPPLARVDAVVREELPAPDADAAGGAFTIG
ncbi:MAG: acylphosphatase [Pseudomonadota bacterium]|nr:acylphosphatase [Pseudomonadota bacterium]